MLKATKDLILSVFRSYKKEYPLTEHTLLNIETVERMLKIEPITEESINELKKEYECEDWLKVDTYERDFHKYLFDKVVPYLDETGLKNLIQYFKDLNEAGKDQSEYV